MPIKIPNNLPAYSTLLDENVFVMCDKRADQQDIRPLKIAILNLMPKKIETETQLLRLLSNTPLQVDIELVQVASHKSKNTSAYHMLTFYKTFEDIKDNCYDGLVITGAPVEKMEFEDVDYWEELCEIMKWSTTNVYSTIHICWGAQAGLYYHYGIKKYLLDKKLFGIYPNYCVLNNHPLLKGFDDVFGVPQSRYTEIDKEDVVKNEHLNILTDSDVSGVHIIADKTCRQFFITGHSEYDRDTLANEYFRDKEKGIDVDIPCNYFPNEDPKNKPFSNWCCHGNLMFSNWLNYCVYQQTPFDLKNLKGLNKIK